MNSEFRATGSMYTYRQRSAVPSCAERRTEARHETRLPFSLSLTEGQSGHSQMRDGVVTLTGHTHDISPNGISLVGPLIRFGYRYLMGRADELRVTLYLPSGPIEIVAAPVRYVQLGAGATDAGFIMSGLSAADGNQTEICCLIGMRIIRMSETDRALYDEYVGLLAQVEAEQSAFIISIEETSPEEALAYSAA